MRIMKPCFAALFSMLVIFNASGQQSQYNAHNQQDTTAEIYHMKNFGVMPYERKAPDCSIIYVPNESEPEITCRARGKPGRKCENIRMGKHSSGLKPGEQKMKKGVKSKKNGVERMSERKNI